MDKLIAANKETLKVILWVFVSAGLAELLGFALRDPNLVPYYGILNIALYWLNELRKNYSAKK